MTLAFLVFIAALVVLAAVVAFALKPRAEVWTSKSGAPTEDEIMPRKP